MKPPSLHLSDLKRGRPVRIALIEGDERLSRKLLELGLHEGQELTVLHEGPLGRDPLAVRVDDRIIALRRRDALHILVEPVA